MGPRATGLALAHRAVAHEAPELAGAAARGAAALGRGVGAWRPAVAREVTRVAPRALGPLRPHAPLAARADERIPRQLAEGVVREAAPRADTHRLRDRAVAAVAAEAELERRAEAAAEALRLERERRERGRLAASARLRPCLRGRSTFAKARSSARCGRRRHPDSDGADRRRPPCAARGAAAPARARGSAGGRPRPLERPGRQRPRQQLVGDQTEREHVGAEPRRARRPAPARRSRRCRRR